MIPPPSHKQTNKQAGLREPGLSEGQRRGWAQKASMHGITAGRAAPEKPNSHWSPAVPSDTLTHKMDIQTTLLTNKSLTPKQTAPAAKPLRSAAPSHPAPFPPSQAKSRALAPRSEHCPELLVHPRARAALLRRRPHIGNSTRSPCSLTFTVSSLRSNTLKALQVQCQVSTE